MDMENPAAEMPGACGHPGQPALAFVVGDGLDLMNKAHCHPIQKAIRLNPLELLQIAALVILATFAVLTSAAAQSSWTNNGTGDWFSQGNWDSASVPTSSTAAIIGKGTAAISSGTAQTLSFYVGSGGTGSVVVSNGAALETAVGNPNPYYAVLGYGNGSVTVTGANSTWTFGVPITVGLLGSGSLSIENGGKLQQTGNWGSSVTIGGTSGNGSVSISGAGSSLTTTNSAGIHIGNDQQGSLTISNGGAATVGYAFIGGNAGSNGTATVTGSNSKLKIINSMSIANYGNVVGSLTVSAGGNVTAGGSVSLGQNGRASVQVTGSGSKLVAGTTGGGNILMADSPGGNASMTISDGGLVRITHVSPYDGILNLTTTNSNQSSQATLQIGTGGAAGTLDAYYVDGGYGRARVIFNHNESSYVFSPGITGSTSIVQAGTGTTILSGNSGYAGSTTISAGTLAASSINNFGWTGNITIGNARLRADASVDFGAGSVPYGGRLFHLTGAAGIEAASANTTITIDKAVDGGGSLTKLGAGSLVLTGNATQGGGTTISGGALQIGSGGTTGSLAGNIEDNAHMVFNRSNDISFGGIISGSGDVTKLGAGILTFTNINTYSGATFVNAGTLAVDGSVSGAGGLVTVANGATLGGSGTLNRDVSVSSGGNLSSSLIVTGQVTLSNQQSLGAVSSNQTASSGQQLNVTSATGGTINSSAGTAQIDTLGGATLQSGNWGATVNNLTSGNVQTSGGSVVAQQGSFTGTISGTGGLTKTGNSTLTINSQNTYTGTTIVGGGTLAVTAGATVGNGTAPVRIVNNGRFQVLSDAHVSNAVVAGSTDGIYEKVYSGNETLGNLGSFQSNLGNNDTSAFIAGGSAAPGTTLTAQYSASLPGDLLVSDRLTLDGLNGQTFLLVLQVNFDIPAGAGTTDFYLGWLDPIDSTWKNAVRGNIGPAGSIAQADPNGFTASYQDFLDNHGGWNAANMLGAYGVDATQNQVWAVVDHNSEFGAVPEPSTYALLALAGPAFFFIARRKKGTA